MGACSIILKKPSLAEAAAGWLLVAGLVTAISGCGEQQPVVPPETATSPPQQRSTGPAPASAAGTRDISFDDITFEMEKGAAFNRGLLPERVTALAGSRIRIRGYILPSFQQSGLTQFVLVRDNMECCFGPGAALYDCIVVSMRPGRSTNFSVRPVAVTGVFRLKELIGPDGKHLAIYALEGEEVR
jgi:hypothetical protein